MGEESVEEVLDSKTEKLMEGNISLIINNYSDIFSSFDPRSYTEKALSIDFLDECKRAARDKGESVELRLLVPKKQRDLKEEWKIKKRLHEHFIHHKEKVKKEIVKLKRSGLFWVILGILLLSVVLVSLFQFEGSLLSSLVAILEVPGWFLIWEGMDKLFQENRELSSELSFYTKMSQAEINFAEY